MTVQWAPIAAKSYVRVCVCSTATTVSVRISSTLKHLVPAKNLFNLFFNFFSILLFCFCSFSLVNRRSAGHRLVGRRTRKRLAVLSGADSSGQSHGLWLRFDCENKIRLTTSRQKLISETVEWVACSSLSLSRSDDEFWCAGCELQL